MYKRGRPAPQTARITSLPAHTFPANAQQVGEARRFLSAILDGSPAADDAALCLSELASNAITHSKSRRPGGLFTVSVQLSAGCLHVEVHDEAGPWKQPAHSGNGTHGRGLLIVDGLARGWGRTGDSDAGWRVWFEMECP